jgi:hypothetical protein
MPRASRGSSSGTPGQGAGVREVLVGLVSGLGGASISALADTIAASTPGNRHPILGYRTIQRHGRVGLAS